MKEKGFIFSIDSIGAIAIVAVLGAAWILLVHNETGNRINQMDKSAQDNALVNLYNGTVSGDSPDTSREFWVCKKYFAYDEATDSVLENVNCEEAG